MKRLCTAVVCVAVGVAALGHFLGWYHVTTEKEGSQLDVHVRIDENKIHADEVKAEEQLRRYGQQFKEEGQSSRR
ncbi:MAG TPA: hypothetical protein VF278_07865 [Pirellulales bacterium]